MVQKTLTEVAEVIPGFSFREAIKEKLFGSIAVLQANNLEPLTLFIDTDSLKHIEEEVVSARAYVKKGDVVIASRGVFSGNSKANVFAGYEKPVVASSSVHIIRIFDTSILLPEFLALYLNSSLGQKTISSVVTLATIKTIKPSDLRSLHIPIPNIQEQKTFVGLSINLYEQTALLNKKTQINKTILQGALQVIIK